MVVGTTEQTLRVLLGFKRVWSWARAPLRPPGISPTIQKWNLNVLLGQYVNALLGDVLGLARAGLGSFMGRFMGTKVGSFNRRFIGRAAELGPGA